MPTRAPSLQPRQQCLPMELPLDPRLPRPQLPLPEIPPEAVHQQARRMWDASHRLQARYASFEALLANPLSAKVLLTCARAQLVARQRAACSPFRAPRR